MGIVCIAVCIKTTTNRLERTLPSSPRTFPLRRVFVNVDTLSSISRYDRLALPLLFFAVILATSHDSRARSPERNHDMFGCMQGSFARLGFEMNSLRYIHFICRVWHRRVIPSDDVFTICFFLCFSLRVAVGMAVECDYVVHGMSWRPLLSYL